MTDKYKLYNRKTWGHVPHVFLFMDKLFIARKTETRLSTAGIVDFF